MECPDAIDGGICYSEKIGRLGWVIKDMGNGTFSEVEEIICPDVDPGALCTDAASTTKFIAPGAIAAALLLLLL